MKTEIIQIHNICADEKAIHMAGKVLKEGGLVAFPTETVYGLGGNALDASASCKIYQAKGRPSDNPLIVHIADMESLSSITEFVPLQALKLATVYWPGPLTIILKKNDKVPYETTGGLDTVAVRMPNHEVALALIRAAGGFIAAPSANTSGRPSPTKAEHVMEDLKGKIPYILDGGDVGIGLESTIVDFTEEVPTILRPGYINEEMIREVIGEVRMDPGLMEENEKIRPKAPGMRYRHYAPQGELVIVEGAMEKVIQKINELTWQYEKDGHKVGIIATDETMKRYLFGNKVSIGKRQDEESIGRHLYSVLREFDAENVEFIFSESFQTPKMGQAIMNRLMKAAGHHVIEV